MKPAVRAFAVLFLLAAAGCAAETSVDKTNREQAATIHSLSQELKRVNAELDELMASRTGFEKAKADIEKKMRQEMSDGGVTVGLEERGLVVTVLDRVLFDSGLPNLKPSSLETLDKLAQLLQTELAGNMIYIEGHTDNVPIRMTAWRSNWELSMARAAEVLHYFIDTGNLDPRRLAATGYGEFHPIAENNSPENRSQNRRVEIVISPKKV